jgi:gliding motility-associated-like protein
MRRFSIIVLLICFAAIAKAGTVPCDSTVRIPSIFSLNDDGVPGPFRVTFSCPVWSYSLEIFNRWATPVFVSVDPAEGWNGRYFNHCDPQPDGIYYYRLQFRYSETDSVRSRTGTITCMGLASLPHIPEAPMSSDTISYERITLCPGCCRSTLQAFRPRMMCPPVTYRMSVYDRWGNPMFETGDYAQGWDGTKDGQPVQEGVYVWKIKCVHQPGEQEKQYVGSVTVVR